jgi:4-aminobutyrate aminotransferase-like enzyme
MPRIEQALHREFRRHPIGAVLVEPMQARGGIRIPPPGFLRVLRRLCDDHGALLIVDEIYTGFGRTGRWFACEHSGVIPDLICLGKALTGGFPLSACVGRSGVMDAWPASTGEAIHTSTFLGHPVGCAMALAEIAEIKRLGLIKHSAVLGRQLLKRLSDLHASGSNLTLLPRGCGLMAGVEVLHADGSPATDLVLRLIKTMLHRRFILLPEGEHANVISLTPPLIISTRQIDTCLDTLGAALRDETL